MRTPSLLRLLMALALLIGAGGMLWNREPVDWEWPFAVYILYAMALIDKIGERK